MPEVLKVAVVLRELVLPKLAVPGPLTWLQVDVRAAGGFGSRRPRPSR